MPTYLLIEERRHNKKLINIVCSFVLLKCNEFFLIFIPFNILSIYNEITLMIHRTVIANGAESKELLHNIKNYFKISTSLFLPHWWA